MSYHGCCSVRVLTLLYFLLVSCITTVMLQHGYSKHYDSNQMLITVLLYFDGPFN